MRAYMGDARGRFEGNTLVVETTNFTDRTPYRGSSERLRLVERFTPVDDGHVEWAVTFDDPATWARPWTFAMHLTSGCGASAVRVRLSRGQLRDAQPAVDRPGRGSRRPRKP